MTTAAEIAPPPPGDDLVPDAIERTGRMRLPDRSGIRPRNLPLEQLL